MAGGVETWALFGLEKRDLTAEILGIAGEDLTCRRRFLDHGRILLGDRVELRDTGIDFAQGEGLIGGACRDLADMDP